MSVPLKLKDSDHPVELQKFTTSEENYLAYQVGLYLANLDSSGTSRLGLDSNLSYSGSIFNTVYDSDIGTSAGAGGLFSVSVTHTRTGQNETPDYNYDSDYRCPVFSEIDNGQLKIKEMDSNTAGSLLDRINSYIFTNDYPGTYKIGTSSPGADYVQEIEAIATDTTKGALNNQIYNLYKRNDLSTPPSTSDRPVAIKRSNGDSGDYQGLQVMTDRQIQNGIGHKAANRIAASVQSKGIGTYRIYSSAEGSPASQGLDGTWQTKGTITDSRQSIVSTNYTKTRSSNYLRSRNSVTLESNYSRTRESNFLRVRSCTRTSTYSSVYSKTRTCLRSPGFVGDYVGDFTLSTEEVFSDDYTRISTYTRTRAENFSGNYTGSENFVGNYTGNFTRNFEGTGYGSYVYQSGSKNWIVQRYQGGYYGTTVYYVVLVYWNGSIVYQSPSFEHDPAQGKSGQFQAYAIDEAYSTSLGKWFSRGTFQGVGGAGGTVNNNYSLAIEGPVTRPCIRTQAFAGNYSGSVVFTGNYSGNFIGDYARDLSFEGNYTGGVNVNVEKNSQRVRPDTFSRNFEGNYTGDFDSPIRQSNFLRDRQTAYTGNYSREFSRDFEGNYERNFHGDFTGDYIGDFQGNYSGNYTGTRTDTNVYNQGHTYWRITSSGTYGGSTPTYSLSVYWAGTQVYSNSYSSSPTLTSVYGNDGNYYTRSQEMSGFIYTVNYAVTRQRNNLSFEGNYTRERDQNFQSEDNRTRSSAYLRQSQSDREVSYEGNYTGNFEGNYTGDFDRVRQSNFERTRVSNYIGDEEFSRDFEGNYTGDFDRDFSTNFLGNYAGDFEGNYTGNYARDFEGNYARDFEGNYLGTEIGSSTSVIETYTLYVRTA